MSVSVTQQKMFVDGEFVDALSGETMEVLNPATGEVIAEVPRSGEGDVDRAVAAAEKAWETWREKTPKDRMELLLKLADVIDDNAEELARLESRTSASRGGSRSTSPASCRTTSASSPGPPATSRARRPPSTSRGTRR